MIIKSIKNKIVFQDVLRISKGFLIWGTPQVVALLVTYLGSLDLGPTWQVIALLISTILKIVQVYTAETTYTVK